MSCDCHIDAELQRTRQETPDLLAEVHDLDGPNKFPFRIIEVRHATSESAGNHLTYGISAATSTKSGGLPSQRTVVYRRYTDFDMLHSYLQQTYRRHVIPGIPQKEDLKEMIARMVQKTGKQAVEILNSVKRFIARKVNPSLVVDLAASRSGTSDTLATHMTRRFIDQRIRMLQFFLRAVAASPMLSRDHVFHAFLMPDPAGSTWTQMVLTTSAETPMVVPETSEILPRHCGEHAELKSELEYFASEYTTLAENVRSLRKAVKEGAEVRKKFDESMQAAVDEFSIDFEWNQGDSSIDNEYIEELYWMQDKYEDIAALAEASISAFHEVTLIQDDQQDECNCDVAELIRYETFMREQLIDAMPTLNKARGQWVSQKLAALEGQGEVTRTI